MNSPTSKPLPGSRAQGLPSAGTVLAGLGVLAAVYFLRPILVPIALGLLLSCLLSPSTHFIRRYLRVSQFTAALILFLLIGSAGSYLGLLALDHLAEFSLSVPIDLSRLNSKLGQKLTDLVRDHPALGSFLPEPRLMFDFIERNSVMLLRSMGDPASYITTLLSQGMLTLILAVFFTVEQPILEPRLAAVVSRSPAERHFYENLLRHLARRMRRYLVVRTAINLLFGLCVSTMLFLQGVHYAVILGVMAAFANFIPYLGQIVTITITSVVAMAQTGAISDLFITAGLVTTLSLLEGYLVTPIVMGQTMDLNGTTVLISCLFWGFLWGIVGLFLATPFAAIARLTLERFPSGRKWALLMSVVPESEDDGEASPEPLKQNLPDIGHEPANTPNHLRRKQK